MRGGEVVGRVGRPPRLAIVSRLERSIWVGSSRPGGEDDGGDLQSGGAGGFERQQGVVDRAQAGGGDDHQRVAEVGGEVAHQVGRREEGDEQAADPLADDRVGAVGGGAGGLRSRRSGSISSPAIAAARWGDAGGP